MSEEEKKGKPGLGNFLEGLNNFVDIVVKLQETGEILREGEFKGKEGEVSGVYGVRIKTGGPDRGPSYEPFGNVKKGSNGPLVADEREPLVDVFNEKDAVTIVAEIPGAAEESIDVSIDGCTLRLRAKARDRKYYKEVTLPTAVEDMPRERSYLNGMFSIVFDKAKSAVA
ncbi:MAG: Hsp20/alpha crystallin family protein [Candidatus Melainabacteria bacterium]|nr:Hsp20/alpha crystallin family protein [Candidatus Melainabacteria bacterium]